MKINNLLTLAFSTCAFSLFATIFHVTPSGAGLMNGTNWENAFPGNQLQLVIDIAEADDQVWVSCGTYYTTDGIDREIAFHMKNNVGFTAVSRERKTTLLERVFTCGACSILSGAIGGVELDDNSYHVISNGPGLSNTAILDGFVVEDANDNRAPTMTEGLGGGVYKRWRISRNSCNPTFRNCVIRSNLAQFGAGDVQQRPHARLCQPGFAELYYR